MAKADRQSAIAGIEKLRESRVITYVTSDRANMSAAMAPDVVRVIYRHLEALGKSERIDLFLYSRGGDTMVPLRLVDLVREHSSKFACLIPFRAHSAATMLCLGADEILMGPLAELGPVDPTTANAFNPETQQGQKLGISVEDVTSYFSMAKEMAGLGKAEQAVEVYKELTRNVHPLVLGNVQRIHRLGRRLARRLLALHMNPETDKDRIDKIVDTLSEKLHSHEYPVTRREAAELGLPVKKPGTDLENAMWKLFECYEADMKLGEPFDPAKLYSPAQPGQLGANRFAETIAYVETSARSDGFVMEGTIVQVAQPGPSGRSTQRYKANVDSQGWKHV